MAVGKEASGEIVKARTDKREYRRIVLPNSLQVLLISDPDTDKANPKSPRTIRSCCAASMDVRVGSFCDPDGLEGLAHFLVKRTDRKMEGRVEHVEKEVGELVMNVGGLKEVVGQFSKDIGAVKEYMKEFSRPVLRAVGNQDSVGWRFLSSTAKIHKLVIPARAILPSSWRRGGRTSGGGCDWTRRQSIELVPVDGIQVRCDLSVAEFRERFELLSAPLREADEEFLIGAFSNGPTEEIKAEVRMVKPASLIQLMDLAQKVEEKNWAFERA
ncbi:hypothetical protein L484_004758 [Morus notabilis]|uniref:Peptidase M16 N-terminal domain-containing protein n=1 Tax=Morus notabilis TaxID=981085 RepID=W9QMQ3_9ROSA|nr:hypothetical protein L484_004758 [Morus notabilis]